MARLSFEMPLYTKSEANGRGHTRAKIGMVKAQRFATRRALEAFVGPRCPLPLPLRVRLTRIAPRELDDDNAVSAMKHVRDEIAAWLGVSDRKRDVVRYEVEQEKGAPKTYGVRVEILPMEAPR